MAIANPIKSEELLTNTTAASKYMPIACLRGQESASMEISPFKPHFIKFSKTGFFLSKTYFTALTFRGTFNK